MDPVTLALMKSRVASVADEWLEENIAQETGYVLDRNLTMENAAAPADLVGEISGSVEALGESLESLADDVGDIEASIVGITSAQIDALFS